MYSWNFSIYPFCELIPLCFYFQKISCRYCPRCKEHRQATKKLDLWRLPEILVFHLKRFSYSRYLKNKLDAFVNFPVHNLDLRRYVKSKDAFGQAHVYELYAVSNHYGGLGGGHYSAYAKVRKSKFIPQTSLLCWKLNLHISFRLGAISYF